MLLFKKDIVNSLYKCIYFFFSHHKVSLFDEKRKDIVI